MKSTTHTIIQTRIVNSARQETQNTYSERIGFDASVSASHSKHLCLKVSSGLQAQWLSSLMRKYQKYIFITTFTHSKMISKYWQLTFLHRALSHIQASVHPFHQWILRTDSLWRALSVGWDTHREGAWLNIWIKKQSLRCCVSGVKANRDENGFELDLNKNI